MQEVDDQVDQDDDPERADADFEQARRHRVKPGITGLAQVKGRNAITWEEKFQWDVWYVDHWSLRLDLRILWTTVEKVIRREGINQQGQATMEKFGVEQR